jgi:hypothetical protein
MSELHVYAVCYADGYEEVCFVAEKDLAEGGGVAVFESDLREKAKWFYPLGKIESEPTGRGDSLEIKPIKALWKAWEESGSPKVMGKGAGPSPFGLMKDDHNS